MPTCIRTFLIHFYFGTTYTSLCITVPLWYHLDVTYSLVSCHSVLVFGYVHTLSHGYYWILVCMLNKQKKLYYLVPKLTQASDCSKDVNLLSMLEFVSVHHQVFPFLSVARHLHQVCILPNACVILKDMWWLG